MDNSTTNSLIIEFALTFEQFTIEMYTHLAAICENDSMKKRFYQLYLDKTNNKSKLFSIKNFDKIVFADGTFEKIDSIANQFNISSFKDISYKDALLVAMQNEKSLFKFYLALSDGIDEPKTKQLFSNLAQDVAQHKLLFELEYEINFEHPFIEIDNSKCNLCNDCVTVCSEVVGANALKLVEHGVAPSSGVKLQDTNCESCGMCIAACPTNAITEKLVVNYENQFLESFESICNYCSVGCSIKIFTDENGTIVKVDSIKGTINTDASICKYAKFGYQYLNDAKRIIKPLLKVDGVFEEISFKEAYDLIATKIKSVAPNENAFFAGARLTNEEIYLIQKLARAGAKTNNITSMHYIKRGAHIINTSFDNVPFEEISGASKIYLMGTELNLENPVVGFMVYDTKQKNNIQIEAITLQDATSMEQKCDSVIKINSYYHFIKAVNHYIISNKLYNMMFINDNCDNFDKYCANTLSEDYNNLLLLAGVDNAVVSKFANEYNEQKNAILLFTEKEISAPVSTELYNLTMLTGKLGKTSNGLIALKVKNNSQGVFDMGAYPTFSVGYQDICDAELIKKLENSWEVSDLPTQNYREQEILLREGKIKNIFIFGEDPIGCSIDKDYIKEVGLKLQFGVVQDYFMTETAKFADLVLPASLPFEIGGHFTNTQRYIQKVSKTKASPLAENSYQQINALLKKFGVKTSTDSDEVMFEAISLLPDVSEDYTRNKYKFVNTADNFYKRLFDYGCDTVVKYFDEYFENQFKN